MGGKTSNVGPGRVFHSAVQSHDESDKKSDPGSHHPVEPPLGEMTDLTDDSNEVNKS